MFKKVLFFLKWLFILTFLPAILLFAISTLYSDIKKTKFDYQINKGLVDIVGFTERVHQGKSMRSIKTRTKILYVKLINNDNLYSFHSKNPNDYQKLFNNLKKKDTVTIYSEGINETSNTIQIIQLEKTNNILINKSRTDEHNKKLIIFTSTVLFLYFAFPIFFIIMSKIEEKKVHKK